MRTAALVIAVAGVLVGGCVETRVVKWRPLMGGLPGANTQETVTAANVKPLPPEVAGPIDQIDADDGSRPLVIEGEDGSRTLLIRSARDLMYHITWTLEEGERELFADEVLSTITRDEFRGRGLDPREAFDMLEPRQRAIRMLFARMPQGEFTPGMVMKAVGGGVYRLQVRPNPQLDFTGMDLVNEGGHWKLRWFVR